MNTTKHPDMLKIIAGELYIANAKVNINNIVFKREISRGANGMVFEGFDPYLERRLAIKFWLKIKPNDKRDKVKQGINEARKSWDARKISVAEVYYSGVIENLFYTVMEYIEGVTLKEYLQRDPLDWLPLGAKFNICEQLIELNFQLIQNNIVHGDLHWNNIIPEIVRTKTDLGTSFDVKLKIIDFGTSYYSGADASLGRNYKVITQTISQCTKPFDYTQSLNRIKKPNINDANKMRAWLSIPIFYIRAAFYELGHKFVGWPFFVDPYIGYKAPNLEYLNHYKALVEKTISEEPRLGLKRFIGVSKDWSSFDGNLRPD